MKINRVAFNTILLAGILCTLLLTLTQCRAQGGSFGAPIDAKKGKIIKMQDLFADLQAYEGKNVIIQGKTGQICQASGCWLMLMDGPNSLFVQFFNFTVRPSVGSTVRVQGVVRNLNKVPALAGEGLEIIR